MAAMAIWAAIASITACSVSAIAGEKPPSTTPQLAKAAPRISARSLLCFEVENATTLQRRIELGPRKVDSVQAAFYCEPALVRLDELTLYSNDPEVRYTCYRYKLSREQTKPSRRERHCTARSFDPKRIAFGVTVTGAHSGCSPPSEVCMPSLSLNVVKAKRLPWSKNYWPYTYGCRVITKASSNGHLPTKFAVESSNFKGEVERGKAVRLCVRYPVKLRGRYITFQDAERWHRNLVCYSVVGAKLEKAKNQPVLSSFGRDRFQLRVPVMVCVSSAQV